MKVTVTIPLAALEAARVEGQVEHAYMHPEVAMPHLSAFSLVFEAEVPEQYPDTNSPDDFEVATPMDGIWKCSKPRLVIER